MLALYGHPFSSYTWKVLIPLYADGTEFEVRQVPENEENYAELKRIWPFGKFPLLLDDGEPVIETTCIIEHLQAHRPGPNAWIPDGEAGRQVRFLDRFFDLHVQGNMQPAVNHALLLDAFHAQPVCVVTPTEPEPAVAPTLAPDDPSDHEHAVEPPCVDARKFATVCAF